MIKSIERQQEVIAEEKIRAIDSYSLLWQNIIKDWSVKTSENGLWLTYAANYLLHTANVHWAIDPYSLFSRLGIKSSINYASTLAPLQLIVLTHWHNDHFDKRLLSELGELPLIWVIPEFMQSGVEAILPLKRMKVITPQVTRPICFQHLTLTPFKGLHFHGNCNGVPEMGYLVEFDNKRWLFPGDTRTYKPELLPDFGKLDGVIAHCWLGKAEALNQVPSQMDAFCQFFGSLNADKIVVSHLNEFGRDADDLWRLEHFNLVRDCLQADNRARLVFPALMGNHIDL